MSAFKRELWQRAIQITANILVLAALCLGMYMASQNPDEMLAECSRWFFPLLGGILLCVWVASRIVRHHFAADSAEDTRLMSVVHLPKQGAKLVRWTVVSRPRDTALQKLREAQQHEE